MKKNLFLGLTRFGASESLGFLRKDEGNGLLVEEAFKNTMMGRGRSWDAKPDAETMPGNQSPRFLMEDVSGGKMNQPVSTQPLPTSITQQEQGNEGPHDNGAPNETVLTPAAAKILERLTSIDQSCPCLPRLVVKLITEFSLQPPCQSGHLSEDCPYDTCRTCGDCTYDENHSAGDHHAFKICKKCRMDRVKAVSDQLVELYLKADRAGVFVTRHWYPSLKGVSYDPRDSVNRPICPSQIANNYYCYRPNSSVLMEMMSGTYFHRDDGCWKYQLKATMEKMHKGVRGIRQYNMDGWAEQMRTSFVEGWWQNWRQDANNLTKKETFEKEAEQILQEIEKVVTAYGNREGYVN